MPKQDAHGDVMREWEGGKSDGKSLVTEETHEELIWEDEMRTSEELQLNEEGVMSESWEGALCDGWEGVLCDHD